MLTVKDLRKRGFKVKVNHYRCVDNFGGATVVNIDDGSINVTGISLCNYQDQFNRKRGLRIALGRACLQLGLPTK